MLDKLKALLVDYICHCDVMNRYYCGHNEKLVEVLHLAEVVYRGR